MDGGGTCVPGSNMACQCDDGAMGQQTCLEGGQRMANVLCPTARWRPDTLCAGIQRSSRLQWGTRCSNL